MAAGTSCSPPWRPRLDTFHAVVCAGAWAGVLCRVAAGHAASAVFAWHDYFAPDCLIANLVGCFVMGVALALEERVEKALAAVRAGDADAEEMTPLLAHANDVEGTSTPLLHHGHRPTHTPSGCTDSGGGSVVGFDGGAAPGRVHPANGIAGRLEELLAVVRGAKAGFCGALTTFSSWAVQVAFLLLAMGVFGSIACEPSAAVGSVVVACRAHGDAAPSAASLAARWRAVYRTVHSLVLTVLGCGAGLELGVGVGRVVTAGAVHHPQRLARRVAAVCTAVGGGVGCVVLGYLLAIGSGGVGGAGGLLVHAGAVPAAGVAGALLRGRLGAMFNTAVADVPSTWRAPRQLAVPFVGTLAANALAVAVYAVAVAAFPAAAVAWAVLTSGFCGALSTVSSVSAELRALWVRNRRRDALVYLTASLTVAIAICGAVWGVGGLL